MIKNRAIAKVIYFSPESSVTVHLSVDFISLSHALLSKLVLVNTFNTRNLKLKSMLKGFTFISKNFLAALFTPTLYECPHILANREPS